MEPKYLFIIFQGERKIQEILLEQDPLTIGRSNDCDIQLDDGSISRVHARIRLTSSGVEIERLSQFGKMKINGESTPSAILENKDEIEVGPFTIHFKVDLPNELPKDQPKDLDDDPTAPLGDIIPEISDEIPIEQTVAPLTIEEANSLTPVEDLNIIERSESPAKESLEFDSNSDLESFEISSNEESDMFSGSPPLSEEESPEGLPESSEDEKPRNMSSVDLPNDLQDAAPVTMDLPAPATPSPEDFKPQEVPDLVFKPVSEGTVDSGPVEIPSMEFAKSSVSIGNTQGSTKVLRPSAVRVCLVFSSGGDQETEFEIRTPEVSIGRSATCDIVLHDKKVSRKNSIITRRGMQFTIRDLDSVNGTFVNEQRVTETSLNGGDLIRIGDTEFKFKVLDISYEKKAPHLKPASTFQQTHSVTPRPPVAPPMGGMSDRSSSMRSVPNHLPNQLPNQLKDSPTQLLNQINGGMNVSRPKSLWGRALAGYRNLPPARRMIYIVLIGGFIYLAFDEMDTPSKKSAQEANRKVATPVIPQKTFADLSAPDKQFVERQYVLAFDLYGKKDYDNALFEIRKIFQMVPDYKAAREIERYAIEGQRRLATIQEDQKKREDEEKIHVRIVELSEDIQKLMNQKQYDKAMLLFPEILSLDPENTKVTVWKKEIDDADSDIRRKEVEAKVKEDINRAGWEIYKTAQTLKNQGKCFEAIKKYKSVLELSITDSKLTSQTNRDISSCKGRMIATMAPFMEEAKSLEEKGQIADAFKQYEAASKIDPTNRAAFQGMERLRSMLTDMAKVLYTEAVIAESYSDFDTAKTKFKETLAVVPDDDIYHQRAVRKLQRYTSFGEPNPSIKNEGPAPASVEETPTPESESPGVLQ